MHLAELRIARGLRQVDAAVDSFVNGTNVVAFTVPVEVLGQLDVELLSRVVTSTSTPRPA